MLFVLRCRLLSWWAFFQFRQGIVILLGVLFKDLVVWSVFKSRLNSTINAFQVIGNCLDFFLAIEIFEWKQISQWIYPWRGGWYGLLKQIFWFETKIILINVNYNAKLLTPYVLFTIAHKSAANNVTAKNFILLLIDSFVQQIATGD